MSKDNSFQTAKFLPFDRYHIAPISDLNPDALKKAAKLARTEFRDDEKRFTHNTALNYIAKSLGFSGGFGGYSSEFTEKLTGFMQKHGLTERRDVLNVPNIDATIRLSYRTIADRLFESGLPVPKRIFTGTGVDYGTFLATAAAREDMKVGLYRQVRSEKVPFEDIKSAEFTTSIPPFNYCVHNREGVLHLGEISYLQNLIGNQLCDLGSCPSDNELISQVYGSVSEQKRLDLVESGKILWSILMSSSAGWVEVIQYNEHLFFLKGANGSYEFVFKGMRDKAFKRNMYVPYLRSKDVSTSDTVRQFEQWLYFNYSGWLEKDRHISEQEFYESGGTTANYPGEDVILMDRMIRTGQYIPEQRKAPLREGFKFVDCVKRKLCVSELVTNRQFAGFIRFNPDYAEHRSGLINIDPWESNDDPDMPVAVTWYDAMAYARWVKRTKKLPVRLLNEEEYLVLAGDKVNEPITNEVFEAALGERLCRFHDPHGMAINGQPPYMSPEQFDQWELRYDLDAISWRETEAGLKFLQSVEFGEWLQPEGAAINSLFFCSQYDVYSVSHNPISAERGRFSPTSTGKYKSMKIGFRLAYETD